MQKVEALFRLQTVDLEVEERTRRLHDVEGQLGESEELLAAREAVAKGERELHEAEVQQREREWVVARIEGKRKEVVANLYSGKSRPAKELATLQKEVEHLQRQQSKEEDTVLEAMGRLEDAQSDLARLRQALVAIEQAWHTEQEKLAEQRDLLQAELANLAAARKELLRVADPAHLPVYEALRRQKGGRAVARVEQNTCMGCRIVLAMQTVQRARTNPGLTYCSSCGRIIYVPR